MKEYEVVHTQIISKKTTQNDFTLTILCHHPLLYPYTLLVFQLGF